MQGHSLQVRLENLWLGQYVGDIGEYVYGCFCKGALQDSGSHLSCIGFVSIAIIVNTVIAL